MALFSKDPAPSAPRGDGRAGAAPVQPVGTFIGPNVVIDGAVSGSDPLVVEGTVRGKINVTSDLRIGTKARVEATVHARNVTVEGKVTGDVSADDKVELVTTANVDGNIRAPRIVVAEGAMFRGSVDMGSKVPKDDVAAPPRAKDVAPAKAK